MKHLNDVNRHRVVVDNETWSNIVDTRGDLDVCRHGIPATILIVYRQRSQGKLKDKRHIREFAQLWVKLIEQDLSEWRRILADQSDGIIPYLNYRVSAQPSR